MRFLAPIRRGFSLQFFAPMSLLQQANEFREAFGFSNHFSIAGFQLQKRLINEEYYEVVCACVECQDKEFNIGSKIELLKELSDLVFVCYQMAAYMNIDLDTAMSRVFESNMSKLGEDGKPVRREDGKVLKGPNYQPPELLDLVFHSPESDS
jgi:predicted HAD superfamily Cof-like phosphohydrolase